LARATLRTPMIRTDFFLKTFEFEFQIKLNIETNISDFSYNLLVSYNKLTYFVVIQKNIIFRNFKLFAIT